MEESADSTIGDQYLPVAFEQDTKLICTYAIGKRDKETTDRFIEDITRRVDIPESSANVSKARISTDAFGACPNSIASSFGHRVGYGQIVKSFHESEQPGGYGPPSMVDSDRRPSWGLDSAAGISTSHVERNNLTIRTFLKRFTRLSLGFSKKLDNLRAAVALHVSHYNFCRIHSSIKRTPALAAGVTDRL